MHDVSEIDLEKNLIEENQEVANEVNNFLREHNIKSFNLVGSIGSGKTSLIKELSKDLSGVGAIVGDVSGKDDYDVLNEAGVPVVNLNTGKECHLDANLVKDAIKELNLEDLDYLFIENVGNLVCPVDFPVGADERIVVVSVTEGDDVVNKHPLLFKKSGVCVINKIDIADAVDADVSRMVKDANRINPGIEVIKMSIKEGVGLSDFIELI
ncbi:MAG: Ni2+-binding GTPase, involved in maturation of urease and hydrogenase HypB [Candidatus Methanohalarchaeum thermophilum]|uniref:Ni2+-binding GTPase, involved in maturation of urease and hydrogenase HypB n=1 Tax=Methanohalarchaeum thermophilum TaxID=1903181 RepID=A0A1Q6DXB2_METT1|nr:MAG: Ni2+-binding GTPase, involved in maturation of urease and hydrogenase HypB [Candidatus Methanohalarchaeum thermophilum]